MTSDSVAERDTALSKPPGGRLRELSRLPRLGAEPWPEVAAAHRGRHGARPGERDEQVTLVAACSALQTMQLAQDLTDPVLPGMPPGPWISQLPQWFVPCLDASRIGLLLQAAVELDRALTSWPLPPPTRTVDLLVRNTLIRMTRSWAAQTFATLDTAMLASVLEVDRGPGALRWDDATEAIFADPVEKHARGLERLDAGSWDCPLYEPRRDPRIVFQRRRPASPSDRRPGFPMVIEFWGLPGRRTSAAQSRPVYVARSSARQAAGQGFTPTGRPGDAHALGTGLRGTFATEALLTWQPLLGTPTRQTHVLLRGLEVDERGGAWLLVIWADSLIAIPLRAVVTVESRLLAS